MAPLHSGISLCTMQYSVHRIYKLAAEAEDQKTGSGCPFHLMIWPGHHFADSIVQCAAVHF